MGKSYLEELEDGEPDKEEVKEEVKEIPLSPEHLAHIEWCEKQWAEGKHPPAYHGVGSGAICPSCEPKLVPYVQESN